MKRNYLYILFFVFVTAFYSMSCGSNNEIDEKPDKEKPKDEVREVAEQLWKTSSLQLNDTRRTAFDKIQSYADACSAEYFKSYLRSTNQASEQLEKTDPILNFYKMSFDKVLDEVRTTKVEEGTAAIWLLYNMGYVVKTPSGAFGIDISHRYAERFAPYLDFLCVTHNHADHYSNKLIQAMMDANKPVLSNYIKVDENYQYASKVPASYTIGDFKITTNINDHNRSSLFNFVTTFQINCGVNSGNLVLMHVGDSNYRPSQYKIAEQVNVFIPRYAPNALTENNVIGTIAPDYVLLSHILELAHAGVEESRWTLALGLERASKLDSKNSFMPFWGEKLTWKNNKLN